MKTIPFNDRYGLTQAVLNGTKTKTRRTEKNLQRIVEEYELIFNEPFRITSMEWNEKKKCFDIWTPHSRVSLKTRYKLGEVVAVAQSGKCIYCQLQQRYGVDIIRHNG